MNCELKKMGNVHFSHHCYAVCNLQQRGEVDSRSNNVLVANTKSNREHLSESLVTTAKEDKFVFL